MQISEWLANKKSIDEMDIELYAYAIEVCVVSIIPLIASIVIGSIISSISVGLGVILPFIMLRRYTGGYHAQSFIVCTLSSVSLLCMAVYIVEYLTVNFWFSVILIIAILELLIFSPVDTKQKPLKRDEKKIYKTRVKEIIFVILVIYIVLLTIKYDRYAIAIGIGIILTAILQVVAILKKLNKYS